MRRTQAKIIDILRLDYETFVHSAFLQQGRADAFTLKTAAERKRILSDILGLDRWTDYESDAKTRLAARQAEIELLQADIRAFDDELQKAPQLQAELDSAIAALAAAQAQLDEANAAYEKVAHSAAALRRERDSLRELDERIGSRQSDIAAAQSEAQRQQQRIDSCREVIAQSDDIAAGYAELQAARSSQSAIAEQLAQQQDLERRCHELERALADEGAELEGKAASSASACAGCRTRCKPPTRSTCPTCSDSWTRWRRWRRGATGQGSGNPRCARSAQPCRPSKPA